MTGYDVAFAWDNAATFSQWELNPVAVWLGLPLATALRVVSVLACQVLLALSDFCVATWGTVVVGLIHLALLAFYFL